MRSGILYEASICFRPTCEFSDFVMLVPVMGGSGRQEVFKFVNGVARSDKGVCR